MSCNTTADATDFSMIKRIRRSFILSLIWTLHILMNKDQKYLQIRINNDDYDKTSSIKSAMVIIVDSQIIDLIEIK